MTYEELQDELNEQSRLLGMSAEREAKLLAEIEVLKREKNQAEKQEPIACVQDLEEVKRKQLVYENGMDWKDPLYTSPQPQKPLTDEEFTTAYHRS